MNLWKISLIAAMSVTVLSCAGKKTVSEVWQSPSGLAVTESVLFDQKKGQIFVSNINGKPTERNAKGFISLLATDGSAKKLEWVAGLDAPKGMGLYKGILFVSDIDRLRIIDVQSAKIIQTIQVDGAKFLNDIAINNNGEVYISDTGSNQIYHFDGNTVSLWLEMNEYKKPNGLLYDGKDLLVGTAVGVVRVDESSKTQTLEIAHTGGIDGLKSIGNASYAVSDWKGKIHLLSSDGSVELLSDTTSEGINAADFEYVADNHALLVPTFFDHKVTYFNLTQ